MLMKEIRIASRGSKLAMSQSREIRARLLELDPSLTSGEVVDTITDPYFRVPTTIAGFGKAIYAVNARFGTEPTPETEYEVVRVLKH